MKKSPTIPAEVEIITSRKKMKPQTGKKYPDKSLKRCSSTNSNGANLPANIGATLEAAVEKRNRGRASTFTEDKALVILESIADGSTVQQACDKAGVSRPTFYVWKQVVPGFQDMVRRAHESQAASMVDDGMKILEKVDVDAAGADPKLAMAQLRKAEQIARFKFDLAKCFDYRTFGEKKQNLNVNLNADVSPVDLSAWLNK